MVEFKTVKMIQQNLIQSGVGRLWKGYIVMQVHPMEAYFKIWAGRSLLHNPLLEEEEFLLA